MIELEFGKIREDGGCYVYFTRNGTRVEMNACDSVVAEWNGDERLRREWALFEAGRICERMDYKVTPEAQRARALDELGHAADMVSAASAEVERLSA